MSLLYSFFHLYFIHLLFFFFLIIFFLFISFESTSRICSSAWSSQSIWRVWRKSTGMMFVTKICGWDMMRSMLVLVLKPSWRYDCWMILLWADEIFYTLGPSSFDYVNDLIKIHAWICFDATGSSPQGKDQSPGGEELQEGLPTNRLQHNCQNPREVPAEVFGCAVPE